ncbi:MAG TPA: deoxyribonuclease IV [Phycisphaerae bacterium]|nr:deoxyribonuclease IV [Phycisphaerae bacterium]
MPRFGAHLSIQGGVDKAVERARTVRAECLQIFLKSPSQWRFGPLSDETVGRFRTAACDAGLAPLLGHASYLVNLASPDRALYERSRRCVLQEWDRSERLGLAGLVLHPGAHMGSGEAAGLARIARAIDWLHRRRPDHDCRILLETTAGAGTVLGGRFEHLQHLIETCDSGCATLAPWQGYGPCRGRRVRLVPWAAAGLARPCTGPRLGVAIDTCHLWAAGYDVRSRAGLDETLGRLDETVGLARVAVVHANDAKGDRGSHLDRHEHIGRGRIGREGFRRIVNHPALRHLPFILETPKEGPPGRKMDPVNLRALRRLTAK